MWKSAYVGVYQLLNCKMHGETLKYSHHVFVVNNTLFPNCCSQGKTNCRTDCWSVNSVHKISNNEKPETSNMFKYSSESQFKTEWN